MMHVHNSQVTVVIPTLNEARYLPLCLATLQQYAASAIRQVIIVDAGSTDDTVAIAEKAGATVLLKRNSTIAGQRNLGADVATTEFIAFLDADCTVETGWSEHAIEAFDDATVVSVGAPPEIPTEGTSWVQRSWSFLKRKRRPAECDVSWIASANVWVRKEAFEQIGGFDESLETCEDADLGFRLKQLGRIISDPKIRVQHHREPRTLREFYRKEVWHGKHSFDGIAGGRLTVEELPSLLTPILFVGSCLTIVISFALTDPWAEPVRWLGIGGIVLAPLAYTFRAVLGKGHWLRFPMFLLIYFVYFTARADAFVRWLTRRIWAFGGAKRRRTAATSNAADAHVASSEHPGQRG